MITTRAIQFAFDNDAVYFLSIFDWCNGIKNTQLKIEENVLEYSYSLIIIILIFIIITSPSTSASRAFVKINLRLLFGLSYSKDSFFVSLFTHPTVALFIHLIRHEKKKLLPPPRIIFCRSNKIHSYDVAVFHIAGPFTN